MHKHHPDIYDVVIAGGGPVGLFLACELRLLDLSVLVLERSEDPHSPLKRLPFGMRGLSAGTLEALYRRGLLDEVVAAQRANDVAGNPATTAHRKEQPRRPAGHFAGIQFYHDDIDTSKWPYRLPSPAGTSMAVALETLETVLARRASALGAEIRRGCHVDEFHASDEDVAVHAGRETFRGRWLVGCDGGRSAVRKAGVFDFVGTAPEFTGYSVEVEMADPEALPPGRHYTPTGMYTYARPGIIAMVEFDGGAFHRTQPVTLEHVQAVLRRVSGTQITLTNLRLATTWTDRAFQVTAYRKGRVLLAGDAAHIHSPLGGQGLNLGIGDALNLGWKLASTIRGDAPAGLLDSYQLERHPEGARVLDWSRAQVALMYPPRDCYIGRAASKRKRQSGDELQVPASGPRWPVPEASRCDQVRNEIALRDLNVVGWPMAATEMAADLYAMLICHHCLVQAADSTLKGNVILVEEYLARRQVAEPFAGPIV